MTAAAHVRHTAGILFVEDVLQHILLCLVVGISDGDTIKVRCGDGPQERVRIAEIDAPERKQPFGTKSKQALSDLIYMKHVELLVSDRDRYGRIVARVLIDGKDAGFAQVSSGMAWCYDAYVKDRACYMHQDAARAARAGLWSDEAPMQPWEWRKARR